MPLHTPAPAAPPAGRLPLGPEPSATEPSATLEGAVSRITYVSEESQYVVARLEVPGRPDPVTIVGTLPSLTPGEVLRLHGRWSHHPKYGEQFKVERYEPVVPATVAGIQRYLGSGMIKGIGRGLADRLVTAFGTETLKVIQEAPARLREVDGIGPKRSERIAAAWAEQREIREVMLFLQGHGVSPAYAARIFKTYGQEAIRTVRENPFRLARDIRGIGFKTADRIARELGVPADSPYRAEAGILHTLHEQADEGHVFVPEAELLRAAAEGLEIPAGLLPDALAALAADKAVAVEPLPEGRAVYPAALHAAETQLARRLRELLVAPRHVPSADVTAALAAVEQRTGLRLTEEQRQAVRLAFREKLLILTGGPGTGKTTILKAVIRLLEAQRLRMHLASPTGRAAKRLAEVTGHEAATLHRLLEWSPREGGFQRSSRHPLETDVLIVDEASMIDVVLAHHLVQAIPLTATLLLVGDADQLPSVGPGTVLQDLLRVPAIPSVRLTRIFRQAAQSRIVSNAHRVNRGEFPDLSISAGEPAQDFFFLAEEDPLKLQQLIVDLVQRRLPAKYGFDPLADIQVLTPMHRGPIGAGQLNGTLQAALNPPRPAAPDLLRGGRIFRAGDRVLQIRNNYDKGVFNGDLGRIAAIEPSEQLVTVRIDDRDVPYDYGELDELNLAYAMTVHKSQGSEYPCVVLPVHTTHYTMLQRNLLYTAITRAKRLLVAAGTQKAIAIATRNDAIRRRYSGLAERLVGEPVRGAAGDRG